MANKIRKSAIDLYDKYIDKVRSGGSRTYYYNQFVDDLNHLFLSHIESSTGSVKIEDSDISKLTNDQILAEIDKLMLLSVTYPKKNNG